MIALKYVKVDRARYISHIDILRHITRTIRRAGIDMGFSNGFNPHMLLKLSLPCVLGIGSIAEYMAVDCKGVKAEEFLKLYNENGLDGLQALKAWDVIENPNFQAKVYCADYTLSGVTETKILDILAMKEYIINYVVKGKNESKDIRPLIIDLKINSDGLLMRLAAGNDNLRIDRFINSLNENYHINADLATLVKTNQYARINNKLISFDDMLDKI